VPHTTRVSGDKNNNHKDDVVAWEKDGKIAYPIHLCWLVSLCCHFDFANVNNYFLLFFFVRKLDKEMMTLSGWKQWQTDFEAVKVWDYGCIRTFFDFSSFKIIHRNQIKISYLIAFQQGWNDCFFLLIEHYIVDAIKCRLSLNLLRLKRAIVYSKGGKYKIPFSNIGKLTRQYPIDVTNEIHTGEL